MSLLIIFERSTGTPTYNLKAHTCEHAGTRMPTQAGLPDKEVMLLDLGINVEQITVSGTVDTNPTKAELRDACADWYADISVDKTTKAITGYAKLTVGPSEAYYGEIKQYSFRLEEAKEDRQEFSFVFLVSSKVP